MAIEMTLNEAVKRCEIDGGFFYDPDGPARWSIDENGRVFSPDFSGEIFTLHIEDFSRVWVYEPPEKLAFKKWNNSNLLLKNENDREDEIQEKGRMEGWNGFADELLKQKPVLRGDDLYFTAGQVQKLKVL